MIAVNLDDRTGVLYAMRRDVTPVICSHAPNDMDLVFSRDAEGNIVGITILGADEADLEAWMEHPDRSFLPAEILDALDRWFLSRL